MLFGEVWERPGLSKRDRSLVTVTTLIAGYKHNELPGHLRRGELVHREMNTDEPTLNYS